MSIIGSFPYTISNGQNMDAIPVMSDLSYIQNQVNNNVPTAITAAISGAMPGTAANATLAATATNALACSGNSATATNATNANNVLGVTNGSNAAAGSVGEFITATAAVTPSGTQTITSINLTAGDWDVWGSVDFQSSGFPVSVANAGISTTNNALPANHFQFKFSLSGGTTTTSEVSGPVPMQRVSVSVTTPVYLVANMTGGATNTCDAYLAARRVR